jgi:protein tyrosine phosphatase (PTP) superfamily phosphohydrolase (DUF442 family)
MIYVPSDKRPDTGSPGDKAANNEINSRFAGKDEWNGPATVGWAYSIDDAKKLVQASSAAFAVYFCPENVAKTAGEGPKAIDEYKKANNGAAPPETLFDSQAMIKEFNTAGITTFVKIPASKENEKLLQSFAVVPNTLAVCAPNGEKLWTCSGAECTPAVVTQFLTFEFKNKLAAWKQFDKSRSEAAPSAGTYGVQKSDDPRLPKLLRFSQNLYSGSTPATEAAFQCLKALGVKTVISVDGAAPNTVFADRMGMTYVHLPVPFREVPKSRALEIARAIRDLPAPLYIHCSSGTDRAPAAAAIASVMLGQITAMEAIDALKLAGCSPEYSGLYDAVNAAVKLDPAQLEAVTVNFTAKSEPLPLNKTMVEIDAAWVSLANAKLLDWKIPDTRKDVKPDEDILRLLDLFIHAGTLDEMKNDPGRTQVLADGQRALAQTLHAWRKDPKAAERTEELNAGIKAVLKSCRTCHDEFRGHSSRK